MNFKFNTFIFFVLLISCYVNAQQKLAPNIYMMQFTDKNYNTYILSDPQNFLSSRSLSRRTKQNISIESNDLPLSPAYLDSLKNAGFTVLNVSKWLNAVTVQIENDSMLTKLSKMSFVVKTSTARKQKIHIAHSNKLESERVVDTLTNLEMYGTSLTQIAINNGQYLHNNSYKGKDMLIAVLDGGFNKSLTFSSLQTLWSEQRVILQRDLVDKTSNTFYTLAHGANVLSIMAGNKEGYLVGSAPEASYALIRCEDAHTETSGLQYEYLVEEFNWVAAAELADSIGADIINSSLGYNLFNDSTMDHTYQDMDGKTTLCTQGANIASSKGILVIVSAGNEGNNSWKRITAPSDASNILCVGSINASLHISSFSSRGPSSDLRVKPDVVAMGEGVLIQNGNETFATGNGTSFSAPVISGLTACLWQAYPDKTNLEIIDAIKKSSSQYDKPDSLMGYGIPNFQTAFALLQNNKVNTLSTEEQSVTIYPNPSSKSFTIKYLQTSSNPLSNLYITDIQGKKIANITAKTGNEGWLYLETNVLENKAKGLYILHYQYGVTHHSVLIVKQ